MSLSGDGCDKISECPLQLLRDFRGCGYYFQEALLSCLNVVGLVVLDIC